MARKRREEVAGGIHHVYARGNDRQLLFWDDEDRLRYLKGLRAVVGRQGWRCFAFCLMDNHVHLLVQTPVPNLGDGMRLLHGGYALILNRRHKKVGHVFQGRFGSKVMRSDEQLWNTARYIQRNPVEAGLCRSALEWRWSSHRATVENAAPPWLDAPRLLSYFATMGGDPRSVYRDVIDG
jgi:REP element-mobilizing transposase RayT